MNPPHPDQIVPHAEYQELLSDARLLNGLINAGVTEWEGWPSALELAGFTQVEPPSPPRLSVV